MASYRLVAQNERESGEVVRVNGFEIGIRNFGSEPCRRLQEVLNKDPDGELAQALLAAGQLSRSRTTGHGYIMVGHTGLIVPQSCWAVEGSGTNTVVGSLSDAAFAQINQCREIRTMESSSVLCLRGAHEHEIPVSELKKAFGSGGIQFEAGEPLALPLHMTMCEGGHWNRADNEEVVLLNWPDYDAGERFLVGRYEEEGAGRILVLEPATDAGNWIAYSIVERPSFQVWAGVHAWVGVPYRSDRIEIRTKALGNTIPGWCPVPVRFYRTS